MTKINNVLAWLILPLILLIAGCGFHLRGMQSIPNNVRHLYIDTAQYNGTFVQTFIQVAANNDIQIQNSPQSANVILKILSDNISQPQLTSMTGSGQAGFYNVYYSLTFSVLRPDGTVLIAPSTLQESRSFSTNASQALSGIYQTQQLTTGMQNDIAQAIINQLAKVSS